MIKLIFMNPPNLPFELSEDATTTWLQSLAETSSVKSANQFYKVIFRLRRTHQDANKIFRTIVQLTPSILETVAHIETSLLQQEQADKQTQKIEKLCIQLLRNLSLCYARLSIGQDLSLDKKNQALYLALQLIGLTQRITTLFHQFPSSTLWEKTGALYMKARSRDILLTVIKHPVRGINSSQTIDYIIKRNLLFAMFLAYQYSAIEVNALFLMAERIAHLLIFDTKTPEQCCYFWPLNGRQAPEMNDQFQFKSDLVLAIDNREIISFLKKADLSAYLSESVLNKIIYRLDGYTPLLDHPIPSRLTVTHLIIGLSNILDYLGKVDQLNRIQAIGSQTTHEKFLQQDSIELVEYDTSHLSAAPVLNQEKSLENLLLDATTAKVIETNDPQCIITESYMMEYSIGQLILLHYTDKSPMLGIIRQVKKINVSATQHTLIEKINGIPALYQIQFPDMDEKRCIVMKSSQAKNEIVVRPGKYAKGTLFELSSNHKLALNRLIDHSRFIMRYTVSFQD